MLYQWSMTSVEGRDTAKQRQVRAGLEELIAGLSPGEPLPVSATWPATSASRG